MLSANRMHGRRTWRLTPQRWGWTLFFCLITVLFSCNKLSEPKKQFLIGFSQCSADAWREVMNEEMIRELSLHHQLSLEIKVSENNNEIQIRQIDELVEAGVDLLIVAPNEAEPLTPKIEEVFQLGIPVILIDRKTTSDQYTAFIGADNEEIGTTAAHYLAHRLGGKGSILEIRMAMSITPAQERARGFRSALAEYPDLSVIDSIEIPWDTADMYRQFPHMIERSPKADAIFAQTDLLAEIAHRIISVGGSEDEFLFMGVDGIPGTGHGVEAVKDSILDASLLYPTGGAEAIQLADKILSGEPFDRINLLQTTVIDQTNARILSAQMEKQNSLQAGIDQQIARIQNLNAVYRNQRVFISVLIVSLLLTICMGAFLWLSLKQKQRINHSLERKNVEVLEQQEKILAMSEELKEATQAKVNFFTNISHEFRTPLTLIMGFAEDLVPSNAVSQKVKQHLRLIGNNAARLLRLVNQLMDFRKVETNHMLLKASEQDVVRFVRNVMESFSGLASRRYIDFKLVSSEDPLLLWFDPDMLDKILFNLLSNAFKYTPDGGMVHILISRDGDAVRLSIQDSGEGIDQEDLTHIFELFYQGEKHHMPGSGIGLSLSKYLVELHQGTIEVSSEPGQGTIFTLRFPVGKAHLSGEQVQTSGPDPLPHWEVRDWVEEEEVTLEALQAEEGAPKNNRILIVEDNEELLHFLKTRLSREYRVLVAQNGEEALDLAFRHNPDLVISDVMMPGKDGFAIVKSLKEDLRTSHIPVILLTARSSLDQMTKGVRFGADAYISKPFHFNFLLEKIRSVLLNRDRIKRSADMAVIDIGVLDHVAATDREFLTRLQAYISKNYQRQTFQVHDLCEAMGLSRSQLYRKVKSLLGKSVTDLIQECRLDQARKLLAQQDLTISEIAYEVGYGSPDYFSTVFKNQYGMVPSHYRRQLHQNQPGS